MKALKFVLFAALLPFCLKAQNADSSAKVHFINAKTHLENMLNGKEPMSYEEAIYQIENAWWEGQLNHTDFSAVIDYHVKNIQSIIAARNKQSKFAADLLSTAEQKKHIYERALANYSIYSYMTDTLYSMRNGKVNFVVHQTPFTYSQSDPFGTNDWTHTQVASLLQTRQGNCFALTSAYKIFSERLKSDAKLCTAPNHIYIRHADDKGTFYNIELASKAFPGTGTLETITYTPTEAVKSGIALRELDLKQSIALCLVYLAKGYEYKFNTKDDEFMLSCAETTLKYDDHNLNAMLLKAELLENRLFQQNKDIKQLQHQKEFKEYQDWITHIFKSGYREMPFEMKNILIKGYTKDTIIQLAETDHTPKNTNPKMQQPTRYASLSWGLFDEEITTKPFERYGNTVFDTKRQTVVAFLKSDILYNQYNFDPVIFAMNVDPLAHKMPGWSPYSAMADNPILNFDPDGAFPYTIHVRSFAPYSMFGGGFAGDGRGYSTGAGKLYEGGSITSRVQQSITVDPTAATIIKTQTWSDYSHHAIFGTKQGKATGTITNITSSSDNNGNNSMSFTANSAGKLPLIPSADIDVHTSFTLTENVKAGRLDVTAIQRGDQFPSAETFIGDSKGNQLFIGVSPAVGFDDMQSFGPYEKLPGDNNLPMMKSSFSVSIDKNGVFTGVMQGDKSYSTSDWNNMMQSQPTTAPQAKPLPAK